MMYKKQKAVTRHYSMTPRMGKAVDKYSKIVGRTKSGFIQEAIRRYIKYIRGGGI